MPAAQEQPTGLVTIDIQPTVDSSRLPTASDTDLILDVVSYPEYEHSWRLNGAEWKGMLSDESYLDRELFLLNSDITRDGAATGWILTSTTLPPNADGSRPILASCETTRKNAYVAKAGNLEKIISHGIGSVHCRPEYRGKGYGVRMIKELSRKLDNYQQLKSNKGRFSVLYSDIGPKYYAKHGWVAFPSTHITMTPIDNAGEYHQRHAAITPLRQIDDVKTADLQVIEPSIVAGLEQRLIGLSTQNPDKTFVAFKPEMIQFQWHFMREEFLAEIIGRESPDVKGAVDRRTGITIIWVRTYSADSADWHLSILHVYIPNSKIEPGQVEPALAALLLRAQWEAKLWHMNAGVELWDPTDIVERAAKSVAYGKDVQIIHRDQEHICSLKWNGSEQEKIVWVANERFAWC